MGGWTWILYPATLFEVWLHKHLRPAVVARVLPERVRRLAGDGDLGLIVDLLEHPDASLGKDPEAARRDLLQSSLSKAVKELEERLGPEADTWTWGRLHRVHLLHPLSDRLDAIQRGRMNPEVLPVAGSHETVGRASFRNSTFDLTAGASVRLVMDVGSWDNSMATNAPGQSGDPGSPHYQDLLRPWSKGQHFPLVQPEGRRAGHRADHLDPAEVRQATGSAGPLPGPCFTTPGKRGRSWAVDPPTPSFLSSFCYGPVRAP